MSTDFAAKVRALPATDINQLLVFCSKNDCSDLFIKVGESAMIYRYGILYQTLTVVNDIAWNTFANEAISSELNTTYVRQKMLDFSYTVKSKYRYRVNCSFSEGKNMATFRMISDKLPTFNSLKINKTLEKLLTKAFSEKQGILLLCGATGQGKTSTLAACINAFSANNTAKDRGKPLEDGHLITLEDPIEYLYPTKSATRIVQKELGKDFLSFELGIKSALREHPSHILVGETRDKETIKALVEGSRTGHTMISTYHTATVSDTLSRLSSALIGENQEIMFDLISNLDFVLCQRLIKGYGGYTLDYQYLFFIDEVKKVLTEAVYKNKNIPNVVSNLMKNPSLQKLELCSNWTKKE